MLKSKVNDASEGLPYPASIMETMGDRIRSLRESRNLTQDDLGKIVGISGAAIAQWESGAVTNLRPENFVRFVTYFNIDPAWLLWGPEGDPLAPSAARVRRSSSV